MKVSPLRPQGWGKGVNLRIFQIVKEHFCLLPNLKYQQSSLTDHTPLGEWSYLNL